MRGTDYMMGGKSFTEMTAAHLMERDIRFGTPETSAHMLAKEMIKGNFGSMPIVDKEKRLIGIVSEFDLLEAILSGMDLKSLTTKEIMKHPFSVSEEEKAEGILRLLQKNHLIRVPVTDKEGKVVGMVARRDLLCGYVEDKEGPPHGF